MSKPVTETLHNRAQDLDALAPQEIAAAMAAGQSEAAAVVVAAIPAICAAAAVMTKTIRQGATLYYVGAGSSGLMAAADAMELGGTFGIPAHQIRIVMAGGLPSGPEMPGATEDDTESLAAAMAGLGAADTVLAVSASGATPYAVAAADLARQAGAKLIGIANNAGSPLLKMADHPILLSTPPELVAGSTRLGAGTAQKIALNTLSSLMGVLLGHIHDGMMVNVVADNAKLRGRASGMVATIAGVDAAQADAALASACGRVKPAVLIAAGKLTLDAAEQLLNETKGNLRAALARL